MVLYGKTGGMETSPPPKKREINAPPPGRAWPRRRSGAAWPPRRPGRTPRSRTRGRGRRLSCCFVCFDGWKGREGLSARSENTIGAPAFFLQCHGWRALLTRRATCMGRTCASCSHCTREMDPLVCPFPARARTKKKHERALSFSHRRGTAPLTDTKTRREASMSVADRPDRVAIGSRVCGWACGTVPPAAATTRKRAVRFDESSVCTRAAPPTQSRVSRRLILPCIFLFPTRKNSDTSHAPPPP